MYIVNKYMQVIYMNLSSMFFVSFFSELIKKYQQKCHGILLLLYDNVITKADFCLRNYFNYADTRMRFFHAIHYNRSL